MSMEAKHVFIFTNCNIGSPTQLQADHAATDDTWLDTTDD